MEWKKFWQGILKTLIVSAVLGILTWGVGITYFYWEAKIEREHHKRMMLEFKCSVKELKEMIINLRLGLAEHEVKIMGGDERDQQRARDTERALIFEEDMEKEGVERDMTDGVIEFDNH